MSAISIKENSRTNVAQVVGTPAELLSAFLAYQTSLWPDFTTMQHPTAPSYLRRVLDQVYTHGTLSFSTKGAAHRKAYDAAREVLKQMRAVQVLLVD